MCLHACTHTILFRGTFFLHTHIFRDFCIETKKLFLTSFNEINGNSWIYLTPTVHGILEHAPELIKANESKWLGDYIESDLECNNKILRLVRIVQSRKCNRFDNLTDCINRRWVLSDIHIRNAVPSKKTLEKTDLLNSKQNFRGPLPFPSLADYYIRELVKDDLNL